MNGGTSLCIKCGKPSTFYGGHVIGQQKMALGNLIDVEIVAGWCSKDCYNSVKSWGDRNGCYGKYDNVSMGYIKNVL